MSRTPEAQRDRETVKPANRNRTILIAGGFILVGALALVFIVTNMLNQAPYVEPARLELDPSIGNPDAPVTIIEYGAYACPACRRWHQDGVIETILEAYPDQVRFVFRDFPIINPAYDVMAAEVAQCALDQSEEGFWALHNALYESIPAGSSLADILLVGEQVGLDGEALRECAETHTNRATVNYDLDRARSLALPGTPSFLVNDARIFNATPDILAAAVEEALAASTG